MKRFLTGLSAVFGAEEVLLVLALVLVTAGLWAVVGRGALTVPGVVLLWIAMPSRAPFVSKPPVDPRRKS